MKNITQEQVFQRWDTLPEKLKESLVSQANSDFLWKTAKAEHLPEEKISIIAKLAGYILMGFIHPEDMAEELRTQLNINPQLAKNIADALNSRIFSGLREELDKIYAPPVKTEPLRLQVEPLAGSVVEPPRIIEEVKKPTEPAKPIAPEPAAPTPFGKPSPLPSLSRPPAPTAPKPTTPPSAKTPTPPAPPSAVSAEPVFIHKEAGVKPITPKPGFRLEIPIPKPPVVSKPPSPPEPAKIEIGSPLTPKPLSATEPVKPPVKPPTGKTEVQIPKVIHYSQWKTPVEKPAEKPEPVPLSQLSAISVPKPPPMRKIEPSLTPGVEPVPQPPTGAPKIPASEQGLAQLKQSISAVPAPKSTESYKQVIPPFPPAASRAEPPIPKQPPIPPPPPIKPLEQPPQPAPPKTPVSIPPKPPELNKK